MPFAKNNPFGIRGSNRQANTRAKPSNGKSNDLSLHSFRVWGCLENRKQPAAAWLPCFLLSSLDLQSGKTLTYAANVRSRIGESAGRTVFPRVALAEC